MCLALFVLLFMARAALLDLACGPDHNCVFERGQGAMKCWGRNGAGQLGYDDANDTNNRGDDANEMGANLTFVHIGTGFVVEDMNLGRDHSCAKSADRAMKCFGGNSQSQLGFDGETSDVLPFLVFGADFNVSKIAAGGWHTCALSTDAALKCFGGNQYGQCGAGTTTTPISGPPSQISAIDLGTNFMTTDVETFWWHTCVKSQQGTAKCFGLNGNGQLGYGDTTYRGNTPESMGDGLPIVDLGSNFIVAAIATGRYHSCALSTTKTVKCWGYNLYGQCGIPYAYSTETGDNLPVLQFGADFVPMQLALGAHHTCILSENAALICFGYNSDGQLGIGNTNDVDTPSTLTGIDLGPGFVPRRVAAGYHHNCAVSTTDTVKCWGGNAYGQLGLGHTNNMGDGANEMSDNLPFVDVCLGVCTTGPTTTAPTTESDETPQPAGTTKLFGLHWLVVVALCIASVCCCGAVVVAIRCVMRKQHRQPQYDDVDEQQHAQQIEIPVHTLPAPPNIHAIDSQSDIEEKRDASDMQVQPGAGGPDLASTHESSMSNRAEGLRASVVAASTAGLVNEHHVQPIQTQGLEEDEFEVVDDEVTAGHTHE